MAVPCSPLLAVGGTAAKQPPAANVKLPLTPQLLEHTEDGMKRTQAMKPQPPQCNTRLHHADLKYSAHKAYLLWTPVAADTAANTAAPADAAASRAQVLLLLGKQWAVTQGA